MSYTALYRKFRPQVFGEVKGQDHIVRTLRNQVRQDRLAHAYLFCGTRGTGKTSVAKILARAVNCENPIEGEPCGECEVCRAISEGRSMNVMEIDAASNNGVDNIREINEAVTYPPTEGRYKVYIIDEVHMLSIGAFNALLKTLEEPPEYVIFILATTEANKIPITILSRCQRYDFRRISVQTIADNLSELMAAEGVSVQERAIRYVAKMADGSMRDALSLLDRCLAFEADGELSYETAIDVLGASDTEVFARFLMCVVRADVKGAIDLIDEIIYEGRELSLFVTDFIWYMRNIMLIKGAPEMSDYLDVSEENLESLREMGAELSGGDIFRYIRIFYELSNDMRYATQKRILLEMAVIKLMRPQMEEDRDSLVGRIEQIESGMEKLKKMKPAQPVQMPAEAAREVKPLVKLPEALPEEIRSIVSGWGRIAAGMNPGLKNQLDKATVSLSNDNKLLLVFNKFDFDRFDTNMEDNVADIEAAIEEQIGKRAEIEVRCSPDDRNTDRLFPSVLDRQTISERFGGVEIEDED